MSLPLAPETAYSYLSATPIHAGPQAPSCWAIQVNPPTVQVSPLVVSVSLLELLCPLCCLPGRTVRSGRVKAASLFPARRGRPSAELLTRLSCPCEVIDRIGPG